MRTDISEMDIQQALDYLRDNSLNAAMAKANAAYLRDYTKTVKARLMQDSDEKTAAGQERDAYASHEYEEHLNAVKEAEIEANKHDFLMRAASEKIGVWRTQISYNKSMGELR
jgi:hypothetical protein